MSGSFVGWLDGRLVGCLAVTFLAVFASLHRHTPRAEGFCQECGGCSRFVSFTFVQKVSVFGWLDWWVVPWLVDTLNLNTFRAITGTFQ